MLLRGHLCLLLLNLVSLLVSLMKILLRFFQFIFLTRHLFAAFVEILDLFLHFLSRMLLVLIHLFLISWALTAKVCPCKCGLTDFIRPMAFVCRLISDDCRIFITFHALTKYSSILGWVFSGSIFLFGVLLWPWVIVVFFFSFNLCSHLDLCIIRFPHGSVRKVTHHELVVHVMLYDGLLWWRLTVSMWHIHFVLLVISNIFNHTRQLVIIFFFWALATSDHLPSRTLKDRCLSRYIIRLIDI